jgi:hypothetical protein
VKRKISPSGKWAEKSAKVLGALKSCAEQPGGFFRCFAGAGRSGCALSGRRESCQRFSESW